MREASALLSQACVLCLPDNCGDRLGGRIFIERLWTSRLYPHVFPCGTVSNKTEVCHLSKSTEFLQEAGGACLSAVPSGKGLISLKKAAGSWRPLVWYSSTVWGGSPGEGWASREAGWAAKTVSRLHALFNCWVICYCGQNPSGEG